MASYLPVLQQFFSSVTSGNAPALNATRPTTTGTGATAGQTPFPTDMSSFITLLYSYSALRDWLKLIVIGGLFESCRRLVMNLYYRFINLFFIRASFDQSDTSYLWILVWLSKQPSWSKTRDMQITTREYGGNSPAVELDGEEQRANEFFKSSRKISYLPSVSLTYSLWYKRRWMTITRVQQQTGMYGDKENTLYINILTRDHNILTQLLQEARRHYMAGQQHNMCVYVSGSSNHWNHVACRAKRSMDSIVLDPGIKDLILEDARDFLRSKPWYAERGIPFRRGYLLYGAPGSGKTSMIHCMAGELGLDVYIISLSRVGLDDASLSELVNALPERCIALMEDIDAAFTHGVSRGGLSGSGEQDEQSKAQASQAAPPVPTTSKLSLSGLLNALDGVGAQEGRILFATTNKYSALDAALCRPGRMDLHVEFKNASKYQARELFNRFYLPTPSAACMGAEDIDEKESVDSGYETDSIQAAASPTPEGAEEGEEKIRVTPDSSIPVLPSFTGQVHTGHGPKLSRARIAWLATQFSNAIPERECSMASLQGYLMAYKTRPVEAAHAAAQWVEKEREAKENDEKAKDVEKAKVEQNDDKPAVPPAVAIPAPAVVSRSCQKFPICVTCGRTKIEASAVVLPSPVSSPVSPITEPPP